MVLCGKKHPFARRHRWFRADYGDVVRFRCATCGALGTPRGMRVKVVRQHLDASTKGGN